MAKKRIPLTGTEVSDIGAQIEQVAKGSEALSARLQKVLQSGKSMSRGLAKDFQKIHQKLITSTRQQEASLRRLHRRQARGEHVNQSQLATLQNEIKQRRKQIGILDRVNARTEQQSGSMSKLKDRTLSVVSVTGLLSAAWKALTRGFDRWLSLSKAFRQAMGQISQQTGATAAQTRELAAGVGQMSGVFANLEGVVGEANIAAAGQFVGELTTAWREADEQTDSFRMSMLQVSRGMGLGVEKTVALRRGLQALGIAETASEFQSFATGMLGFSEAIGANSSQILSDMADSQDYVVQFGDDAIRVFREAAIKANNFGFETRKIFEMAKGFDTFGDASQRVNQLNAVLGTTLSSYELMIEQDPNRRVEMITQAVADQGLAWNDLNRIQQRTLAQQLNLTEAEAARVFNNETLADIERDREAAAEQERRDAFTQRENQEIMNRLLSRTGVMFYDLTEAITRFWNAFARLLSPIFGEVNNGLTGIVDKATQWINEMGQDESVQKMIQDVADWIDTALTEFREWLPTWDEFKEKAKKAWATFQHYLPKVIKLVNDIWEIIVEEKEAWDNNTGAVHGFVTAIQTMAGIVVPILQVINTLFEGIGAVIETIATGARDLGLLAIGEDAESVGGGRADSNEEIERRVSRRAATRDLDTRITELSRGSNSTPGSIARTLAQESRERMSRGQVGFTQLSGRGQHFRELVQERYHALDLQAPTPESAPDGATVTAPATQSTVNAPSPGAGSGQQVIVIENTVYSILDGEKVATSVARNAVPGAQR